MWKLHWSSWICFVYRNEGARLVMIYVSKKPNKSLIMDHILFHDENAHHCVFIVNLERFIAYFKGRSHREMQRICRNCFHLYTKRETYQKHVKPSIKHAASEIVIPKQTNTSLQFRNWKARWFLLFVLCFYTESYLVPIAKAEPSSSFSYTVAIEKHETCGYSIAGIKHGRATPVYFEHKRGDKRLNEYVKSLHILARDIYNRKWSFYGPNRVTVPACKCNTRCWICENEKKRWGSACSWPFSLWWSFSRVVIVRIISGWFTALTL